MVRFPPKALINNPSAPIEKAELFEIFEKVRPGAILGAEFTPKELIWWF